MAEEYAKIKSDCTILRNSSEPVLRADATKPHTDDDKAILAALAQSKSNGLNG